MTSRPRTRRPRSNFVGRLAAAALATTVVLAPTLARADGDTPAVAPAIPAASQDTVYLRNDGMVRGRVQEILPGDHVTVLLETGGAQRIPWADVDHVLVAPGSTPPPPIAPSPAIPSPPPVRGPTAHVHIATHGATLYRRPAGTKDLVEACSAPCDADLPLEDEYRIAVSGTTSSPFRLEALPGGAVRLTVEPPSIAGAVVGGAIAWGGGLTVYVAGVTSSVLCSTGQRCVGGLAVAGAGLGALVLGVVVVVDSLSMSVSQKPTASAPAPSQAFVREPVWRSPMPGGLPAAPSEPATFPLFVARF